jgi:DNA-binding response OmpR family regulator
MPKKILIVEDDSDTQEVLRLTLQNAGYVTQSATGGAEAIEQAWLFRPDLVVLDLVLPDVDGFTVCEALRHQPLTAAVPIIILTALPGEFPRLAGAELGANAHMNKPFDLRELVLRIGSLLGKPAAFAEAGQATRPLAA